MMIKKNQPFHKFKIGNNRRLIVLLTPITYGRYTIYYYNDLTANTYLAILFFW